jgi:hypothetical protein
MPFDDSPSLDTVAHGFQELPPPPPKKTWLTPGRKRLYALGLVMVLALLALLIFNGSQDNLLSRTKALGAVSGQVLDEKDQPAQAEVLILGVLGPTKTDAQGKFVLSGLPAGQYTLVAGYQGSAREFPVTIITDQVVELGSLRLVSTAVP